MTDYIDRKAALDAMREYEIDLSAYAATEGDVFWDDAITTCRECVENLPSAEVPHWIPCSERTPESEYAENRLTIASYIVTMQRTTKDKKYSGVRVDYARFIPERKDGKWQGGTWQNDWLVSNEQYDTEVIAWMPIPKPYDPIEGAMNPPE